MNLPEIKIQTFKQLSEEELMEWLEKPRRISEIIAQCCYAKNINSTTFYKTISALPPKKKIRLADEHYEQIGNQVLFSTEGIKRLVAYILEVRMSSELTQKVVKESAQQVNDTLILDEKESTEFYTRTSFGVFLKQEYGITLSPTQLSFPWERLRQILTDEGIILKIPEGGSGWKIPKKYVTPERMEPVIMLIQERQELYKKPQKLS